MGIISKFFLSEWLRFKRLWVWLPIMTGCVFILFFFGLVDAQTQIPNVLEKTLIYVLDKYLSNSLYSWLLISVPFVVALLAIFMEYYKVTAQKKNRYLNYLRFIFSKVGVSFAPNIALVVSSGSFSLFVLNLIPWLDSGDSISLLVDSAIYLVVSVFISAVLNYLVYVCIERPRKNCH